MLYIPYIAYKHMTVTDSRKSRPYTSPWTCRAPVVPPCEAYASFAAVVVLTSET